MSANAQEFLDTLINNIKSEIQVDPALDKTLTDLGVMLLASYNPLRELAKMEHKKSASEKFIKDFIANNKKGENNER